jgi:hypothetical protein
MEGFDVGTGFHWKEGRKVNSSSYVFSVVNILDDKGAVEGNEFHVVLVDNFPIDKIGGYPAVNEGMDGGTMVPFRCTKFSRNG